MSMDIISHTSSDCCWLCLRAHRLRLILITNDIKSSSYFFCNCRLALNCTQRVKSVDKFHLFIHVEYSISHLILHLCLLMLVYIHNNNAKLQTICIQHFCYMYAILKFNLTFLSFISSIFHSIAVAVVTAVHFHLIYIRMSFCVNCCYFNQDL